MRILRTIGFLLSLSLMLSSCNTMSGLGKDVKQGGKAIENAADRHKPTPHEHHEKKISKKTEIVIEH